jgi:hypothetical protein
LGVIGRLCGAAVPGSGLRGGKTRGKGECRQDEPKHQRFPVLIKVAPAM